ncbi:unnamed protein product [Ixodes pacificus]
MSAGIIFRATKAIPVIYFGFVSDQSFPLSNLGSLYYLSLLCVLSHIMQPKKLMEPKQLIQPKRHKQLWSLKLNEH